jgi:hypothetical protein
VHQAFVLNVAHIFTHPDIASLVHPLFRKRERGEEKCFFPLLNDIGLSQGKSDDADMHKCLQQIFSERDII